MKNSKQHTAIPTVILRTKILRVSLTEAEADTLQALSKEIGLPKANLVRAMVLTNADRMLISIPKVLDRLDTIGSEASRSASSLKRILEFPGGAPDAQVLSALDEYISLQRQIENSFRVLIKLIRRKP